MVMLPLLIHQPPRSVGRVQGPELEFRPCSGKNWIRLLVLDPFFVPWAAWIFQKGAHRNRTSNLLPDRPSLWPRHTEGVPALALSVPYSACGRCSVCGSSCLDIPPLFQDLPSIPFMQGSPSSVGRTQGPFWRIQAAHSTKRGPALGKRWRSELRWRWAPFWRIQAAHSTKRGPALGKRWRSELRWRWAPFWGIQAALSKKRVQH